jgi:hypothetical protein
VQFHSFTTSALDGTIVKFHALVALSPGKDPLVLLGGPYSWHGRFGEEKSHLPLPGNELPFLASSFRCLITIQRALSPNSWQSYLLTYSIEQSSS